MKNKLFILSILIIFITSCSNNAWKETKEERTIEAYQNYIKNNSEAEYVVQAQTSLDSLLYIVDTTDWGIAKQLDTIIEYEKYILEHPEGEFINEAEDYIKSIEKDENEINVWNIAKQENTVEAYKDYLEIYYRAEYKYEAYRNIYYIENSEFVEKYKRLFDLFDKMCTNQDFDFNELSKYFSKDTCTYNGGILQPPYTEAKFSKYNDQYVELEYIYSNNLIMSFFDEETRDNLDYYQPFEIIETENGIILNCPPIDIGANGHYFKWEKENEILVLTEMRFWYEGDV